MCIFKLSIKKKIETIINEYYKIKKIISKKYKNSNEYITLVKDFYKKEKVYRLHKEYYHIVKSIKETLDIPRENKELDHLIKEEINDLENKLKKCYKEILYILSEKNNNVKNISNDKRNIYLEIRAGTGGEEASIFAKDLCKMYTKFSIEKCWKINILHMNVSEYGGLKEVFIKISGNNIYNYLQFESGVHRVQRIPKTESQGRIHTSTCTVAVLPEISEKSFSIKPSELKIDTYKSSGAGGQHVNTTDSAVRIKHIPTGYIVQCQSERSQHKNKLQAMKMLESKISLEQKNKSNIELSKKRKNIVGTAKRSQRIRTYNFPKKRVTDHRKNFTIYQLTDLLSGKLEIIISPFLKK